MRPVGRLWSLRTCTDLHFFIASLAAHSFGLLTETGNEIEYLKRAKRRARQKAKKTLVDRITRPIESSGKLSH